MSRTLVTRFNLDSVKTLLATRDCLVFDTETTGLMAYHECRVFSLALADLYGNSWYFNFKPYKGLSDEFVLTFDHVKSIMDQERKWIAHNAKFDLHFTDRADIKPNGQVYDTEVMARLFENHHQFTRGGYSLATCCERWLSVRKDDRVEKWIEENGAYTVHSNAEGQTRNDKHFDLVPFELISEYACKDAEVTGELFKFLWANMYENKGLVELESKLSNVLFEMERVGVKVDLAYCNEAYEFEQERARKAEAECVLLCGGEFTDSAKFLAPLLEARGFVLPLTEKGNPQVTDDVLKQLPGDPLARAILDLRDAQKRASTYWSNYNFLADDRDVIHPNFRQSGTVTGRMSCNSPNLQNIPAEDGGDYPVRKAFVPRPDFIFVSIDFAQMEFRLMLEYAKQMDLIEKIKNGHDPHDSTAELTGLTRKAAKTLNFGLLYGMGVAKLAKAIGVEEHEAKRFKSKYFDALPGVQRFIRDSSRRMETRGYTFNWAGRRYVLEDKKWSYKAANSIIQGGCADICKLAMVRLRDLLSEKRSRMVLQVHDEVLFEIHVSEIAVVRDALRVMETAFEARHMPMACSVAWSGKSFGDMIEVNSVEEIKC